VGGGGIPVIETDEGLQGVAAVIDKDKSSAKLAEDLKADMLVILTAVDRVCIHYNTPQQQELSSMTAAEAEMHCKDGQFAPGSMLPKVESCLQFVRANPNGKALITSLERAKEALEGKTGTVITNQ
jgi:carbamate kinase